MARHDQQPALTPGAAVDRWERMLSGRAAVFALLGLCLILRLLPVIGLSGSNAEWNFFHSSLTDDTFYSLNIARNLATGRGFTFDGLHETNGFQPLYVFLMVPVYWLLPAKALTPVKVALVMLALASVVAGFFIHRILRREVSPRAAAFGLALFSLSPYAVEMVNGLETSLVLAIFLAAYDLYLARVRPGTDRLGHRLGLAALLALLVFARLDGGILAAAIAADYTLRRDPLPFLRRVARMAGIAAASLVFYSPWVVFNWVHFGNVWPHSGAAVSLISQLYGSMELPIEVIPFPPGDIPFGFYLGHLIQAVMLLSIVGLFFPAEPLVFLFLLLGDWMGINVIGSGGVVIPIFLAAIVICFRARKNLGAVFWAVGLTVAAYSFYVFGAWFFPRYFLPAQVCLLLVGMAVLERLWSSSRPAVAVVVIGFIVIFTYSWMVHSQPNDMQLFNYEKIRAAVLRTPAEARSGTFQTGYVGYWSPGRTVVNLDGVVNPKAYEALRDGRMYAYLKSERIEYVADFRNITDRLLLPRLGADPAAVLTPLSSADDPVQVYRVR